MENTQDIFDIHCPVDSLRGKCICYSALGCYRLRKHIKAMGYTNMRVCIKRWVINDGKDPRYSPYHYLIEIYDNGRRYYIDNESYYTERQYIRAYNPKKMQRLNKKECLDLRFESKLHSNWYIKYGVQMCNYIENDAITKLDKLIHFI